MDNYIVVYDLIGTRETSSEYEALIDRIKTYGWAKLQYSAWIVRSSQSVVQVWDHLLGAMDRRRPLVRLQVDGRSRMAQHDLQPRVAPQQPVDVKRTRKEAHGAL
jgi:hypothetical protein